MEITFLSKTGFKFKTKNLTLVVDPVSVKERADVVVYSGISDAVFDIAGAVNREKTFVVDKEGEYELGGVGIILERVDSLAGGGKEDLPAGRQGMIIRIFGDGVEVIHTGAVIGTLPEKLMEKVREADVLLVTLAKARELIAAAEPYIAILMGYESKQEAERFLAANKYEVVKMDLDKLKLEAESLPESTQVVVLNA